jgi:hypothetical protein
MLGWSALSREAKDRAEFGANILRQKATLDTARLMTNVTELIERIYRLQDQGVRVVLHAMPTSTKHATLPDIAYSLSYTRAQLRNAGFTVHTDDGSAFSFTDGVHLDEGSSRRYAHWLLSQL